MKDELQGAAVGHPFNFIMEIHDPL